ncbi:MAG: sulfatase [Gemmatimonadetes bacterium]|nr:sulfatase [Gemmatimonadota bacterium]
MSERPNILWYCSDQQRFDTIGGLGNSHVNTPRLDAIMREAVTFTHTFCQSPICTPSRASFLTGMYPSAVGVNQNGNPAFPAHYADRLVPGRLAGAGYDCGLVGKLHLATAAEGQEPRVEDGYRYFQYSHDHKGPRKPGHDYADWLRSVGADPDVLMAKPTDKASYLEGAKQKRFGGVQVPTEDNDNFPPHLHQTNWCSEKAIEFINESRGDDQPWLLSINPFDPHAPFDPPYEYFRRYDPNSLPGAHFEEGDLGVQECLKSAGVDFQSEPLCSEDRDQRVMQAAYYAMIEFIDHEFGRILDHLESIGERENTIVIFMSDHGEMLGDHGLVLKGCRFYEGLVRVPLIISWPGRFGEGEVSDALVELTDLAPTLYEAVGEEIPHYVQGRSLVPILQGKTSEHHEFVRAEFYGAIAYPDQTHATMIRDKRHKYVRYHGKDVCELYDLEDDPWEHKDLSEDEGSRDVLMQMMEKNLDATAMAYSKSSERVSHY